MVSTYLIVCLSYDKELKNYCQNSIIITLFFKFDLVLSIRFNYYCNLITEFILR